MDNDSSFALSEVIRKLANIIRLGKIEEIKGGYVRVKIERVVTGWLPIVGQAGDTTAWVPITKGEQVIVFSPYGESAQAFVMRGLYYNEFPSPDNNDEVSLDTDSEISCVTQKGVLLFCKKGLDVSSNESIRISSKNALIEFSEDAIELTAGDAAIVLSKNGIELSLGSSSINITKNNIAINSDNITTNPPVCKCTGGV